MTVYCFSVVYMIKMLSVKFFVPPFCRTKCENLKDHLNFGREVVLWLEVFCSGKSVPRSCYLHV